MYMCLVLFPMSSVVGIPALSPPALYIDPCMVVPVDGHFVLEFSGICLEGFCCVCVKEGESLFCDRYYIHVSISGPYYDRVLSNLNECGISIIDSQSWASQNHLNICNHSVNN